MMKKPSILFIGKKDDFYCQSAVEFIKVHFPEHVIVLGKRGDVFPVSLHQWKGDYIISYLSPWIIPAELLKNAGKAGLNFHPGPPEYPGIGCTNFAVYNNEKQYGVTCHHMNQRVDTGEIVAVRRFPLYPQDSVYLLTQRCYAYILVLFYDIMFTIMDGISPLPKCQEHWTRKPYRRSELDQLGEIKPGMSREEINKRVKAMTFPNAPGAYSVINGVRVAYQN